MRRKQAQVCTWIMGLLILMAGCRSTDIETQYGVRGGIAKDSVNGTVVLASMFQSAGHKVITTRRISPRLQKYDVIVWMPDDFNAPDLEQRIALEDWLSRGNRTLIYVGRDFDAAPLYWETMAKKVSPVAALEMWRRRGSSMAHFENSRRESGTKEYGRWFTRHGGKNYGKVQSITSNGGDWLKGIDVSRLDLYLGTTLEPAVLADLPPAAPAVIGGSPNSNANIDYVTVSAERQQRTLPTESKSLVDTDRGPMITQVKDSRWLNSTVYVVANGSFLLNLPLVNTEHRKLAGKLISSCGASANVAFLETNPFDGVYFAEESERTPTGLEVFTVWPLGLIVMHAFVLGIVACFAVFPIFGRARELPSDQRGDFGRHIEALGKLLQRTRDEGYAREQLQQYYGQMADPGERT